MKILCIGQSAFDITLLTSNYPRENEKYRILESIESGGGSASNCAYLLSKWGMEVYIASTIGNDYYGDRIVLEYQDNGINQKYLERKDCNTSISYIINNQENASRTILTNRKKELKKDNCYIDDDFDIILFDGYEKEFSKEAIKKNPNAIKILDAGGIKEATVELCSLMDYIVCSHDFLEDYSKKEINYNDINSIIEAYKMLEKDFPGIIVVTLEERGSFSKINNEYTIIPSIKVNSVDTTGAGDVYHGAFIYSLSQKFSISKTLLFSNIAGALSTTKFGSRLSLPSLEEVLKRYNHVIS